MRACVRARGKEGWEEGGRGNLTKMQHRLLGCIHDPHSIPGATHPPVRESEACNNSSAERFLPRFRRDRGLTPYEADGRRLINARILSDMPSMFRHVLSLRDDGTCWMSANEPRYWDKVA